MHLYSEAHIMYGDYAHDVWNPNLIIDVLSRLTPDNMRADLLLHHFDRTASGNYFDMPTSSLILVKFYYTPRSIWSSQAYAICPYPHLKSYIYLCNSITTTCTLFSCQMCRWSHGLKLLSQSRLFQLMSSKSGPIRHWWIQVFICHCRTSSFPMTSPSSPAKRMY